VRDFFVRVGKTHEDTVSFGNTELYLDNKFNIDFNIRMFGEVLNVPCRANLDHDVKVGDTLIFHHHVVGNPQQKLDEDMFIVMYEPGDWMSCQAIGYISKETGKARGIGPFILTGPVDNPEANESVRPSGIVMPGKADATKYLEDRCEILYSNEDTDELGLNPGDVCRIMKNTDYVIKLPTGEDVYRMRAADLTLKF